MGPQAPLYPRCTSVRRLCRFWRVCAFAKSISYGLSDAGAGSNPTLSAIFFSTPYGITISVNATECGIFCCNCRVLHGLAARKTEWPFQLSITGRRSREPAGGIDRSPWGSRVRRKRVVAGFVYGSQFRDARKQLFPEAGLLSVSRR